MLVWVGNPGDFIVQTVSMAVVSQIYQSLGFVLFNFLIVSWAAFSGLFCMSWAGSVLIVRVALLSTVLVAASEWSGYISVFFWRLPFLWLSRY